MQDQITTYRNNDELSKMRDWATEEGVKRNLLDFVGSNSMIFKS